MLGNDKILSFAKGSISRHTCIRYDPTPKNQFSGWKFFLPRVTFLKSDLSC